MGEVIAAGILKCQLDMLEVRVIGHRHGQSPAGEMRLLIEAQVMLDNRRLRPALQRQVMAIVGGIQRIAGRPLVICISSSGLSSGGCAARECGSPSGPGFRSDGETPPAAGHPADAGADYRH